jgi:hypothetical protein
MEQELGTNLEGTACMEHYRLYCKGSERVEGVGEATFAHPYFRRSLSPNSQSGWAGNSFFR